MNHNTTSNNTIKVANDLLSAIEYCGIDRDGYTDRDPRTTSLCDVQLIGQVVANIPTTNSNSNNDTNTSNKNITNENDCVTDNAVASHHDPTTTPKKNHLSTGSVPATSTTTSGGTTTTATKTGIVLACRFVLASRSVVLYRMLYGNYREAKTQSIALLRYPILILQSIVYFCSYHTLNPLFPKIGRAHV